MQLDRIPIIITRCFQLDFKKKNMKRNRKGITLNVKDEEDHFFSSVDIVNPIDLPYIKSKARTYTSLDEFLVDVQWFVHNCEISFTGDFHDFQTLIELILTIIYVLIDFNTFLFDLRSSSINQSLSNV